MQARQIIVPGPRVQMGRPRLATPLCTPFRHLPGDPPNGDLLPDPSRKFRAILHLPLTFFRTPPPRPALFLRHTHSASAVGERHRCSRKGSATARHIFLGHHSPKYFLTAGHLRCLAGLLPWRVSVDGGEGREEGDEARRAPLPLGAWHGVSVVSVVFVVLWFLKFSPAWWFSGSGDFAHVLPSILWRGGGA